jgi:hypothetical protein
VSKDLVPLKPKQHPVTETPKFTTELPFFYLTKKKKLLNQVIDYYGVDNAGRPICWKVSPNIRPEIGAPGIEAHEIWVRLLRPAIHARTTEAGKLPSIIPLGGVREGGLTIDEGVAGVIQPARQARGVVEIVLAPALADRLH